MLRLSGPLPDPARLARDAGRRADYRSLSLARPGGSVMRPARAHRGAPVRSRNGNNFPTLVAVARATLGDPDASDPDKAGASVVLALGRGQPLTLAEINCALTYLFNLLARKTH